MNQQFNQVTPVEAERLFLLAEDLGGALSAVGKVLRYGYNSCSPDSPELTAGARLLSKLLDINDGLRRLVAAGDIVINPLLNFEEMDIAQFKEAAQEVLKGLSNGKSGGV